MRGRFALSGSSPSQSSFVLHAVFAGACRFRARPAKLPAEPAGARFVTVPSLS